MDRLPRIHTFRLFFYRDTYWKTVFKSFLAAIETGRKCGTSTPCHGWRRQTLNDTTYYWSPVAAAFTSGGWCYAHQLLHYYFAPSRISSSMYSSLGCRYLERKSVFETIWATVDSLLLGNPHKTTKAFNYYFFVCTCPHDYLYAGVPLTLNNLFGIHLVENVILSLRKYLSLSIGF